MNVAVGVYAMAVTARRPAPVRLNRESNEAVRSKTRTFHTQTGSLLLPSEVKKAQVNGIVTGCGCVCGGRGCWVRFPGPAIL